MQMWKASTSYPVLEVMQLRQLRREASHQSGNFLDRSSRCLYNVLRPFSSVGYKVFVQELSAIIETTDLDKIVIRQIEKVLWFHSNASKPFRFDKSSMAPSREDRRRAH